MYRAVELRRAVVSLLLPNRCPFCDRIIGMWDYWCDDCYGQLCFVEEPLELPENLDSMLACCYYTGRARSAVLRMKQGLYSYSIETFAVMMTELAGELLPRIDFITAVPSSCRRRIQLGYAQAECIARDIAKRSGKRFRRVLRVTSDKQEQKQLNKQQRQQNAMNSYIVRDNRYILDKNILVVDDVTTTGATFAAIAGLLKRAGAKSVYGLAFAKTR